MADTSATGLPFPSSGDVPNVPADMSALAKALDSVTVPLFASTTARDAAYATTPFGLCFVGTSVAAGTLYRRRGSSWYEIKDIGSLIGSWQSVTVPSGNGYSGTITARANCDRAELKGILTGGFANSTSVSLLTIPSALRPVGTTHRMVGSTLATGGDQAVITLRFNTNGTVYVVNHTGGTAPTGVDLSALSWPLS